MINYYHHRHIVTHISEILGKSDSGINGSFSGSHGHVGGVGNQTGSLHDRFLFSFNYSGKFGEFTKHLLKFLK
jgi:hypothetical protein